MQAFSGPLILAAFIAVTACARLPEPSTMDLATELNAPKPMKTWKAARERFVVMQRYDYSCGAASMATLLRYYFEDDVTERAVLQDIIGQLTEAEFEERKKKGLSLLDLKRYAERRGYQTAGVELELSSLPQLTGPVLVYLETDGYKHFAILRGVREDRVLLADPWRGNVRMPTSRFADEWPGIALVLGKEDFGTPSDHPLAIDTSSPLRPELQAARRSLYLRP
ncbi:MAG: C39 family peptidase [Gammaproteobacteria bacterium]